MQLYPHVRPYCFVDLSMRGIGGACFIDLSILGLVALVGGGGWLRRSPRRQTATARGRGAGREWWAGVTGCGGKRARALARGPRRRYRMSPSRSQSAWGGSPRVRLVCIAESDRPRQLALASRCAIVQFHLRTGVLSLPYGRSACRFADTRQCVVAGGIRG